MSRSFFTKFRDVEDVEVIIDFVEDDPETNSRSIEWHFGETPRPLGDPTPEEEKRIENEAYNHWNQESPYPEFD